MDACTFRKLETSEWEIYKQIRLEALKTDPQFFGATFAEEEARTPDQWKSLLNCVDILGLFEDATLVATVKFEQYGLEKISHKAYISGVYVRPDYRGKGYSKMLITEMLTYAEERVKSVQCALVTENKSAFNLYKSFGFEVFGIEPASIFDGERYLDDYLMMKQF